MTMATAIELSGETPQAPFEFEVGIQKARAFLEEVLDPNAEYFEFRCIWPKERPKPVTNDATPDVVKKRGMLSNENLRDELVRLNRLGYGIFVTVNETDGDGVKKENVTRVRAVWADWDHGLPDTIPVPPSCVISTSTGRSQAYWLVE